MADRAPHKPRPNTRETSRRDARPRRELYDQAAQPAPRQARPQQDRMQQVILPLGSAPQRPAGVRGGSVRDAGGQRSQQRPRRQPSRQEENAWPLQPSGQLQPSRQEDVWETEPPRRNAGRRARRPADAPSAEDWTGELYEQESRQKGRRRRLTRGEMRRRRRKRRLIAFCVFVALVALGVALSVTVLFKVEGFRLEGTQKDTPADTGIYTEDAILAALNVPLGENIFQFSIAEKERAMAAALPYLETIQVRRSLPGTVVVRVAPAVERYALKSEGGWVILSGGLKVLKISPDEPSGLVEITGVTPSAPVAGYPLALAQDEAALAAGAASGAAASPAASSQAASSEGQQAGQTWRDTLDGLLSGLDERGLLEELTSLDMGGLTEISCLYQGRVRVLLGTANNLDYKLQWAAYLLQNKEGDGLLDTDRGVLDISHLRADGSIQPVFSPGAPDV